MENFMNKKAVEPALIITTEVVAIDYPVLSINFENTGNDNGLLTVGTTTYVLAPGRKLNFAAGDNGFYKANKFSFDTKENTEAPATEFTIIINK